jgi:hypothetical protein
MIYKTGRNPLKDSTRKSGKPLNLVNPSGPPDVGMGVALLPTILEDELASDHSDL